MRLQQGVSLLRARWGCRPCGKSCTEHASCLAPWRRVQSTVGVSAVKDMASGDRDEALELLEPVKDDDDSLG